MVEIHSPVDSTQGRPQVKKIVMPAKAGIQLQQDCEAKKNLNSDLRRNDGKKS